MTLILHISFTIGIKRRFYLIVRIFEIYPILKNKKIFNEHTEEANFDIKFSKFFVEKKKIIII